MPSYDFFAAQRHHKRLSLMFYRLFAFVVFCHALVLLLLSLGIGILLTDNVRLSYWLILVGMLFLYVALGIFVQRYRLAQGGQALAKNMQAVRLFIDNTGSQTGVAFFPTFVRASKVDELPSGYARAYEFCEQISLAAGVPMPLLYVLPNEVAINAFVAGFEEKDTVMVLTQGAIDTLDNESLYGLIAHQYAAIIHGDAKLNLKINIMTTGLSWVYECAEWLEELVLGSFHYKYHGDVSSRHSTPLTQADWVAYWQQEHLAVSHGRFGDCRRNDRSEAEATLFLVSLPIFVVLFLVRFVGLIGMASHDWIVAYFNRERSFLADATSVQLTRSLGVRELLISTQLSSSYLSNRHASHLGYFFFAPIRAKEEFFDTHPSVDERLDRLSAKTYFAKSQTMTKTLDKVVLQKSHDAAVAHAPIVSLMQEVLIETVAYTPAPKDRVVDGRLVVNQAWFDWGEHDELSALPTSTKPSTLMTACHDETLPGVLVLDDLKTLNLAWEISKHQRKMLSTLILVEALQLMRFESLPVGVKFDLQQIYVRSPFDGLGEQAKEAIYPHYVGDELLAALTKLDRRADGILTMAALKKLRNHLTNPNIPLTDRQISILARYQVCLLPLFEQVCDDVVVKDYPRLLAKISKPNQGAVLALLCLILQIRVASDARQTVQQTKQAVLIRLFARLPAEPLAGLAMHERVLMVLLAFLVSVQDNSWLVGQQDKPLSAFVRLLRLACLPCEWSPDEMLVLMEKSHRISVGEWACLLLVPNPQAKAHLETLHTACLYDVALAQKEQDLLMFLGELWQEPRLR